MARILKIVFSAILISIVCFTLISCKSENTAKQKSSENKEATKPKDDDNFAGLLDGVDYEIVLETSFGNVLCSKGRNQCYGSNRSLLKIKEPVVEVFKNVGENLENLGWRTDDGDKITKSQIDQIVDLYQVEKPDPGFLFALLTLNIEESHVDALYKGDTGAYFEAVLPENIEIEGAKDTYEGDEYYLSESDYKIAKSKESDGYFFLSVEVSKESGPWK